MNPPSHTHPEFTISRFIVAGISYRDADVSTRSLFSLSAQAIQDLLKEARELGIRSIFVLSTCNRTELYAYYYEEDTLVNLLIKYSRGTAEHFRQSGFTRKGAAAYDHLFLVAAGIDSQIIGDFEILGQLKNAVAISRKQDMIGPVMDRTLNFAFQASKSVRTNTRLSTGTISVSYAAIEWLKKLGSLEGKKALLAGTGKFGTILAKNLKHYFPALQVTITNRTEESARELAASVGYPWAPFSDLGKEVEKNDIILLCTNAPCHTLLAAHFNGKRQQYILDLSVPENVDPAVKNIPGITLTGIDEISRVMETTLNRRREELPRALAIINEYRQEFYEWLNMQKHVPLINDMRSKLYSLGTAHLPADSGQQQISNRVNRTVGALAINLRKKNEQGCHYIRAINDFLEPGLAHE